MSSPRGNRKKRNQYCQQGKYQKPTQPIYKPPSARLDGAQFEECDFTSLQHPTEVLRHQAIEPLNHFGSSSISSSFPIKGVLKRSKSFGNNHKEGNEINSTLLDDTTTGRFLISMEGLSWENITLIKQALNPNTCAALTMNQLLQIIRILCNKVLEKPINAKTIAKVCLEIHHKQQLSMTRLSDHRYLFLESLANCLREWFNERDKLRFTTGGARRWTAYILFIMEIYLNLKENDSNIYHPKEWEMKPIESSDESDLEDGSHCGENIEDEEVARAFLHELTSDNQSLAETSSTKSEASSKSRSSSKSGSADRSIKKPSSMNIQAKIINSLLIKQLKQFSNLLLDSFQVIMSNPNSTPAEIECMQTVFRKCGQYLEEDNPTRTKAIIFIIRDTLLNSSSVNQFINANNSANNSSITKNLLEIVELAASDWRFDQSQQIYYFPYTKMN